MSGACATRAVQFLCSPSSIFPNQGAIVKVIAQSVAGAQIVDVCACGDQFILEETDQVFKNKKDIKKGDHQLVQLARGMVASVWQTIVHNFCFIVGGPSLC